MVIYNKELSKKHHEVKDRIREKNKDSIYIPYPTEPSETDIVCRILMKLHEWGLDAHTEISSKDGVSRFDIVIFKEKVAQRIIEVKKNSGTLTEIQREKYKKYQLPIDHVRGMKGAKRYLKSALNVINSQKMVADSKPNREKMVEEGQPCRKCGSPVVRYKPLRKPRKGQRYYYKSYLKCRGCYTIYLVNSEKVYI